MRRRDVLSGIGVGLLGLGGVARAAGSAPVNDLPNPYRSIEGWAKLPPGRSWGATSGVDIDPDGKSVWVFERCGTAALPFNIKPGEPFACDGSGLDPILKFDETGHLVKSFGGGMFLFPHGLHVDHEGNVWVTDGLGNGRKGQQIFKFSPDGKVLMVLGKPGIGGPGLDEFNMPSAVYVAPSGEFFVADGHGGNSNARVMKFSRDGSLIKVFGKYGSAPGDIDIPHTLAMDSRGRLFLGDRNNNRIQIFDQEGNLLDIWTQFSRPSGIFIDRNDVIYVSDSESESVSKNHDGWKRGIRVGSARDGSVAAFIPDPVEKTTSTSGGEGVAADVAGNIYAAEAGARRLTKYVKA